MNLTGIAGQLQRIVFGRIGFSSEELDDIFAIEDIPEEFDLEKELAKLDIKNISVKNGDVYQLGTHRLMCGDSTMQKNIRNS